MEGSSEIFFIVENGFTLGQSCRAVAGTNDVAKAGHRCMLQSETPSFAEALAIL